MGAASECPSNPLTAGVGGFGVFTTLHHTDTTALHPALPCPDPCPCPPSPPSSSPPNPSHHAHDGATFVPFSMVLETKVV